LLLVPLIGAKPSQVALAWLLGKGDFIVPIPGTKRRVYLEENAGAVDVTLSADDMARLAAALRPEAVSGPVTMNSLSPGSVADSNLVTTPHAPALALDQGSKREEMVGGG
jgi:hypothetical protein